MKEPIFPRSHTGYSQPLYICQSVRLKMVSFISFIGELEHLGLLNFLLVFHLCPFSFFMNLLYIKKGVKGVKYLLNESDWFLPSYGFWVHVTPRKAFLILRIYPQILCQGENDHHVLLQGLEAVRIIA